MRLSDAIALGRMILRPLGGTFNDGKGGGCALGMAYMAAGLDPYKELFSAMQCEPGWKWIENTLFVLPCGCTGYNKLYALSTIVHLFDIHVMHLGDWTLDQLIDWVRSVEPPEAITDTKEEPWETQQPVPGLVGS